MGNFLILSTSKIWKDTLQTFHDFFQVCIFQRSFIKICFLGQFEIEERVDALKKKNNNNDQDSNEFTFFLVIEMHISYDMYIN